MQNEAAALMDELVTPIAAELQQNCSSEANQPVKSASSPHIWRVAVKRPPPVGDPLGTRTQNPTD